MKKLEEALKKAAKIASKGKTAMPVLMNVLIEPNEGGINISATDLEMRYQASVAGITIDRPVCVELKKLRDISKSMKGIQKITVETVEDKLWVKLVNDNVEAKIVGMDSDEFPVGPDTIDLDQYIEVPLARLKHLIRAASTDETRYNLNGAYVDPEGRLVSTDGHRLHLADIPEDISLVAPTIIPLPMLKKLNDFKAESVFIRKNYDCPTCGSGPDKKIDKLTAGERKELEGKWLAAGASACYDTLEKKPEREDGSEIASYIYLSVDEKADFNKAYKKTPAWKKWRKEHPVEETYNNNKVRCKDCVKERAFNDPASIAWVDGDDILISRRIEGEYPDYRFVIREKHTYQYTADRESIEAAFKQILPMTDITQHGTILHFGKDGNRLSTSTAGVGEMTVKLNGEFKSLLVDPCKDCDDRDEECRATCERYKDFSKTDYDIGLNAKYMIDALENSDKDSIDMFFDSESFGVCVLDDALVMPMRI